MISSRPYLLRAFYDWIVDNRLTPYIVVNADYLGVKVPRDFVENGRIVLNIDPNAIISLKIRNDKVSFNARFGGVPYDIEVPMRAVSAVYAKENGKGMVFRDDDDEGDETPPPTATEGEGSAGKGGKDRPKLTIVK